MKSASKIQNFFLQLQQSNEQTKKQWLIILTSASMLIVIVLWGFYFNATIQSLHTDSGKNEIGFLDTMNNGLRIITNKVGMNLSVLMQELKTILNKSNSITIQGANIHFVSENLKPITPKKLP